MAYVTNKFCWQGLITTDPGKAAAFYPEVLGWKTMEMEMDGSQATLFAVGDTMVAHYMEPPMEGIPPHWDNFLRVDNVDASTKAAVENGGSILSEPDDIAPGRMSVVASPSGAALCLFHEADEATAENNPNTVGYVHWVELHSQEIDKDLEWLKATFGYTTEEMPMPQGGKYHLLMSGGAPCGGAMTAMMDKAPSMWLTWFAVDNCDDALGRVKSNGGKGLTEAMDMDGVGRMAVAQGPTGAVFGVIQPAAGK